MALLNARVFAKDMLKQWQTAKEVLDANNLRLMGHPVMENWEKKHCEKMAQVMTANGGRILEVGFGMAISSTYCQEYGAKTGVTEHWIIEANNDVAGRAHHWSNTVATTPVIICRGFSWEVAPGLADGYFDGILFDTYPLTEEEEHVHHYDFIPHAARLLKPGGILTYFPKDDVAIAQDEVEMVEKHGLKLVKSEAVPVDVPKECTYWKGNSIVCPTYIKQDPQSMNDQQTVEDNVFFSSTG